MSKYLLRRLVQGVITMLASVTITFLVLRLMPGDPALLVADTRMTEALRMKLLADYGLDKPLLVQYLIYLKQLLQGNLGFSFRQLEPVANIVMDRLPWTLLLTGTAFVFTILLGIPLGVIAAVRRGSLIDRVINAFAVTGYAIFVPWMAITLLYFFGYKWDLFPIGGAQDIGVEGFAKAVSIAYHLVLPVMTLVLIHLASYVLFLRTSMIEVLHEDYVRTARAKGLEQKVIIYKHTLRNAFLPTLTMMGLQIGFLVSGAVLAETVFAYPGLGRLIYESVTQLDYPVLQGTFIILAFTVIVANIFTDIAYSALDPRIRYD